ncbi:hypothetical protein KAI46_06070 [bacterium]|nr:hypothetical protein [bacterium]
MADLFWTQYRDALRTLLTNITTATPFPIRMKIGDQAYEFESPKEIEDRLVRAELKAKQENPNRARRLYLGNGGRG